MSREILDALAHRAQAKAALLRAVAGVPADLPAASDPEPEEKPIPFDGGAAPSRDQPQPKQTHEAFLSAVLDEARRRPSSRGC
jgi:hypothetical protein